MDSLVSALSFVRCRRFLIPASGLSSLVAICLFVRPSEIRDWIWLISSCARADFLNGAWSHKSRGQYDNVLINCRKTIEELGEIVIKQGYERKKTLESGDQITVPDWRKFLNQDDMGKNVDEITENIRKYCRPAAHRGKSINREDADYALMITHATANLVLKNLKKTV